MSEQIKNDREAFLEDLLASNYSTYLIATHPQHSKGKEAFRFTSTPKSLAIPYWWEYKDARRRLFELGNLLTPEEAERRNCNFVNPALKESMVGATLPTLRGGIQLLLPGEQAYTHRHSANAFRLILESPAHGAYTVVEGTKIPMTFGDLVLTPNWTWHDHHNEGESHSIWYDGLDALMAFWVGGVFFQSYDEVANEAFHPAKRSADGLLNSFGPGLAHRQSLFPEHIPASNNTLLYYPYSRARQTLRNLAEFGAGNEYEGVLLEYVNPLNAGSSFPTMNNCLRLIDGKSTVEAKHRTENIVFITMEGSVDFHLPDNQIFHTVPFDVTAIPSWIPYTITNSEREPAVLFSNSDKPLFEKMGFYRESTEGL